jgi:hypothetical protein
MGKLRQRMWILAGTAWVVGGISSVLYLVAYPDDGATRFGTVGFFALLCAAPLTLIAIGRRGRRRFVIVFAAATLAIATYQFWTTNWPSRYGETATWCSDNHDAHAPGRVERIPPGVHCENGFIPADGLSWVALGGWSLFYGFALSFPVMAVLWAARQRPTIALPQPPGTTR